MIVAKVQKLVTEINYLSKPIGWADMTLDEQSAYVREMIEEGYVEDSHIFDTLDIYWPTMTIRG